MLILDSGRRAWLRQLLVIHGSTLPVIWPRLLVAAIVAIGAALQKPVVRDGELTVGLEMNVTLSGDHRVIDGAVGAEFLTTLRNLIPLDLALQSVQFLSKHTSVWILHCDL